MKLLLRSAKTLKDLDACVAMYSNSPYGVDPAMTIDVEFARTNLFRLWMTPSYNLRMAEKGGVLFGWLLSREGVNSYHSSGRSLEQLYYVTDQEGFLAARCLKALHEDLVEIARAKEIPTVLSHASHLDPDFLLCKMLAKWGWSTQAYLAWLHVSPPVAQVAPRRAVWGNALTTPSDRARRARRSAGKSDNVEQAESDSEVS